MIYSQITQFQQSLNGVFIIDDFVKQRDLDVYLSILKKLTEKDSMNRETNVKATMTTYNKLFEINEFQELGQDIIKTMEFVFRCKNQIDTFKRLYAITDFWGMKHVGSDATQLHCHFPVSWSGSFCLDCPTDNVKIDFPLLNQQVDIKSNRLIFFPGVMDHAVNSSNSSKPRYTVGFNVFIDFESKQ